MTDAILEIKEITKFYGDLRVFEKLSLTIHKGETLGLLGLNGAGKTTLFKSILNLVKISHGEIHFFGKPLSFREIHDKIGYLPEYFMPLSELSSSEFLRLLGYGISVSGARVNALLEKIGLNPDKKIEQYSRGMVQRWGLAIALLKNPEFVILDEPTLGFDLIAQQQMLTWLRELNAQGRTIFFSSHHFSQVERLCDRIAVMHRGELKFVGPGQEFLEKHKTLSLEDAFLSEVGVTSP